MGKTICDYCGREAVLLTGREIYPHRPDLYEKKIWDCRPCKASVGCHPGTERPLGRLANAGLRKAKMKAHAAFDPIWKTREMRRSEAYSWLAGELRIPGSKCHIGMFDEAQCAEVVRACATPRSAVGPGERSE